jgi:hypothetical protein
MTAGRKLLDKLDDDGPRVFTPDGRRIRGRTPYERAALAEARRMRAAGERVGHVVPPLVAAALDIDRVAKVAAHLRFVLAEIGVGHLSVTATMRDQLEAAAVALEVLRDEPTPIDLDRLEPR